MAQRRNAGTGRRPGARSRVPAARRQRRPPAPAVPVELLFLPGLGEVVTAEARHRLTGLQSLAPVPGRDDSVRVELAGSFAPLLGLRTIVAPFRVLRFEVPRPKALLSGEYLPQISETMTIVCRLNTHPPTSFRFDAAGGDSAVFTRLATELERASGLRYRPGDGDCLLRVRRAVGTTGWEVLVRLSTTPLSARPWRVADHAAGANATVAAAMALLTRPKPADRVINLMCGSGTLLIERLLTSGAHAAVGVDVDPTSITAAQLNLRAADLDGRARLVRADVTLTLPAEIGGPFDVVLADPPWGDKSGSRRQVAQLHAALLEQAHALSRPGSRIGLLTAETGVMQQLIADNDRFDLVSATSVFHKGHYPRIFLLRRR